MGVSRLQGFEKRLDPAGLADGERMLEGLGLDATVLLDTAPVIYLLEGNLQHLPRFWPLFRACQARRLRIAITPITVAEVLAGPWKAGKEALAERYEQAFREGLGWQVVRQRGSHIVLVKDGEIATLSIPDHKEVAKGTLRSLIRTAGITVDEFCEQIGPDENSSLHQTLLPVVPQGAALARRARHPIRNARRDFGQQGDDGNGQSFGPASRASD